MKRIWGYVVSLLACGTIVSAALPACVTNDQSIFVRSVLAPPAARQGGGCVYTPDPQQPFLTRGRLDVGLADEYFAMLLVGNQLVPRGDPANMRAESNRVRITGGVVRITEPDGKGIHEFTSLAMGFNDPQTNNNPGYGGVGLTLIDPATSDILRRQLPNRAASKSVVANVKIFGKTLAEVDVESDELPFPMDICNGCLVLFDGYDPTSPTQPNNCDKAPEKTTSSSEGPCQLGADLPTSCRNCRRVRTPDVCDPNVP